ncbi:MAG: hypothetical protein R6V03_00800 [Kiritimatiellia bacterium]
MAAADREPLEQGRRVRPAPVHHVIAVFLVVDEVRPIIPGQVAAEYRFVRLNIAPIGISRPLPRVATLQRHAAQ